MNDQNSQLQVNNLSVSLGGKSILNDLNIDFVPGKVTAIIGPNGSGKSTLLKSLAGLIKPSTGVVRLAGKSLARLKHMERAQLLTFLMQNHSAALDLTIYDLVSFGRHCHHGWRGLSYADKDKIAWAIAQVGLTELSTQQLGNLSGGQTQRAWLAMALAQDTPIILLDEPTTFLDISHQLEILTLLRQMNSQYNKTIIVVLHDIQQALQFADYLLVMQAGKIVTHQAITEKKDIAVFEQVFGVKVDVYSLVNQPDLINITRLV